MNKLPCLGLLLIGVTCSLALGSVRAEGQTPHRLSVPRAERLVASWVEAHKKGRLTVDKHPRLRDITPIEVWQRLRGQVFKQKDYTNSIGNVEAFFITGEKVYPLSTGFGGYGITSMCVCDLDADSRLELAYVYSWGSGVHRSHLGLLNLDGASVVEVEARFHPTFDIVLDRVDDQRVMVYVDNPGMRTAGSTRVLIGRLRLTRKAQQAVLGIQFRPGLPKEWRVGI